MLPYKLTDSAKIKDARTALICARLYLRGGKRRLQAGYSKAGIAALYDAVLFGMRYYIARIPGMLPASFMHWRGQVSLKIHFSSIVSVWSSSGHSGRNPISSMLTLHWQRRRRC
jgi:hypothetical protein